MVDGLQNQTSARHDICQFFTQAHFLILENLPKKRVNHDISNHKYYVFGVFVHFIGIPSPFHMYLLTLHIING